MKKVVYTNSAKDVFIREARREKISLPTIDLDVEEEDVSFYNDLIIDLHGTLDHHIRQSIRCNY